MPIVKISPTIDRMQAAIESAVALTFGKEENGQLGIEGAPFPSVLP